MPCRFGLVAAVEPVEDDGVVLERQHQIGAVRALHRNLLDRDGTLQQGQSGIVVASVAFK